MSKFFTFNQNNSGGRFTYDESSGISEYVIIEAKNADQANDRAESIGLYFDGCSEEMDCPCCGDRWSRVWEGEGDDFPSLYGEDVFKAKKDLYMEVVFVHYLNGEVVKVLLK